MRPPCIRLWITSKLYYQLSLERLVPLVISPYGLCRRAALFGYLVACHNYNDWPADNAAPWQRQWYRFDPS